jgi:hypothetical protein
LPGILIGYHDRSRGWQTFSENIAAADIHGDLA